MIKNGHFREAEVSLREGLLPSEIHIDIDGDHHRRGWQASNGPGEHSLMTEGLRDHREYLGLYKAALEGKWEEVQKLFEEDPNALLANITEDPMNALHVSAATGRRSLDFVRGLVSLSAKLNPAALHVRNKYESTALHIAAAVGNKDAAEVLVESDPILPQVRNKFHETPLHTAARFAHRDTICYLLSVTRDEDPSPFTGQCGAYLLNLLLLGDFYDIALYLLKRFPELAIEKDRNNDTPLGILARKPRAFPSGNKLGCFQLLLYHCICLKEDNVNQSGEPEFPEAYPSKFRMCGYVQHVYDKKLKHMQTRELVKMLCDKVVNSSKLNAEIMLGAPMHVATMMGIHELVEEIIRAYPFSVWFRNGKEKRNVFHQAVLHRKENVFNLLYHMSSQKHFVTQTKDIYGNNILHLAGMLGPSDQIAGPALQMQQELQWFQEVKRLVKPSFREEENKKFTKKKGKGEGSFKKVPGEVFTEKEVKPSFKKDENYDEKKENCKGKTPKEVFTENHNDLVKKGEEWMKNTASSCTLVATLVVGAAFSGASSPPGGTDSNGIAILLSHPAFMVYQVSLALALFASATSVLMFLGILTSRCAEKDFLRALPKRLCIGLISLFFSIMFMLAAFGSSIHMVLVHRVKWVAAPIVLLACVPITLFAGLQFPLLVKVAWSTFGPSKFGPIKGKEMIC